MTGSGVIRPAPIKMADYAIANPPYVGVPCRNQSSRADNTPPVAYTAAVGEHHMALLNRVFTTRTLLQIIFVLTTTIMMKAISAHYDFSWATALAAG